MGIPGVTLTFSDGSGALTTDENGSFYRELSNGWSGTITPSMDGYSFSPSNIAISSPFRTFSKSCVGWFQALCSVCGL